MTDEGAAEHEWSQLPVWTPIWTGQTYRYEAVDSRGRAWRLWFADGGEPGDPFPRGWRFAPVDELDQLNFLEHVGGGRDFDRAAMRIDAHATAADPDFQHRMD